MPRIPRSTALPLASLALLAAASPAAAATGELPLTKVFEGRLAPAAGTTGVACQAAYRPGTPGVATREVVVPAGLAVLEAAMTGSGGDVDLAIFDASGRAIAAGASPDAQEVASGWTLLGGTLRVQACRRDGDTRDVGIVLERATLPSTASAATARANPPQLVDVLAPTQAERTRVAGLGLDLTEHAGRDSVGVVLHDADDRAALTRAGLRWKVVVPDLVAQDVAARREERAATAARAAAGERVTNGARAVPITERTTYRTLADYETDLKALATENPGLVKLITLNNKTLGGRDVLGVEIAKDVNVDDGKPAFLNMGVHHAREWPSGENAMEWALELVRGVKSGDERITRIVEGSRNIVVPIVNADGFNASREAGALGFADGGRDEAVPDTAYLVAGAATGGEYRRKNCRAPDDSDTATCLTSAGLAEPGVDPNRNYGGLWGGPGATSDITAQTYWGPGPFSEAETRNIKELVGSRHVMSLITNHTTAGLLLRAPGLASLGDPVDEDRGYKALGDAMAKENGYFSQKSFELYDTTGTTEDWTYNTAGGFGFTFEVYCGRPNFETGDCDDPAFHPTFQRTVEEYLGTSPQADHVDDPGRSAENPFGNVAGYDGKGNSEAYKIAAESAMNTTRHSVLSGVAPAGVTLRLKKTFKTETFPQPRETGPDTPDFFDDKLESTLPVGASGRFEWHVNPSTRPIAAKDRGEAGTAGPPSATIAQSGGPNGSPSDPADDGVAVPDPIGLDAGAATYNDHPFTIPATGDNRSATVTIAWTTPATDWDMTLFEDEDGDGTLEAGEREVGTAATGVGTSETVNMARTDLVAGRKYVLRVLSFVGVEPYDMTVEFAGAAPFQPATVEAYTLTCERGDRVLDTQQVIIDRAEAKTLTLAGGCAVPRTDTPDPEPEPTPTDTATTPPPDTTGPGAATNGTTTLGTTGATAGSTGTTATPAKTAPPVVTATCSSRRTFRVSVKRQFTKRLRSGRVLVNGKRVGALSRTRRSVRVNLAGSGRRTVVVRIEMVLAGGKRVVDVRRYRPCARG
ncbi:MAG: hypothetical protein JWO90_1886 [Solirubrobacterales bacterium]|nr:hypothetical protein [Solirubrobacterales bacterium]